MPDDLANELQNTQRQLETFSKAATTAAQDTEAAWKKTYEMVKMGGTFAADFHPVTGAMRALTTSVAENVKGVKDFQTAVGATARSIGQANKELGVMVLEAKAGGVALDVVANRFKNIGKVGEEEFTRAGKAFKWLATEAKDTSFIATTKNIEAALERIGASNSKLLRVLGTGAGRIGQIITGPIGIALATATTVYDQFVGRAIQKSEELERTLKETAASFDGLATAASKAIAQTNSFTSSGIAARIGYGRGYGEAQFLTMMQGGATQRLTTSETTNLIAIAQAMADAQGKKFEEILSKVYRDASAEFIGKTGSERDSKIIGWMLATGARTGGGPTISGAFGSGLTRMGSTFRNTGGQFSRDFRDFLDTIVGPQGEFSPSPIGDMLPWNRPDISRGTRWQRFSRRAGKGISSLDDDINPLRILVKGLGDIEESITEWSGGALVRQGQRMARSDDALTVERGLQVQRAGYGRLRRLGAQQLLERADQARSLIAPQEETLTGMKLDLEFRKQIGDLPKIQAERTQLERQLFNLMDKQKDFGLTDKELKQYEDANDKLQELDAKAKKLLDLKKRNPQLIAAGLSPEEVRQREQGIAFVEGQIQSQYRPVAQQEYVARKAQAEKDRSRLSVQFGTAIGGSADIERAFRMRGVEESRIATEIQRLQREGARRPLTFEEAKKLQRLLTTQNTWEQSWADAEQVGSDQASQTYKSAREEYVRRKGELTPEEQKKAERQLLEMRSKATITGLSKRQLWQQKQAEEIAALTAEYQPKLEAQQLSGLQRQIDLFSAKGIVSTADQETLKGIAGVDPALIKKALADKDYGKLKEYTGGAFDSTKLKELVASGDLNTLLAAAKQPGTVEKQKIQTILGMSLENYKQNIARTDAKITPALIKTEVAQFQAKIQQATIEGALDPKTAESISQKIKSSDAATRYEGQQQFDLELKKNQAKITEAMMKFAPVQFEMATKSIQQAIQKASIGGIINVDQSKFLNDQLTTGGAIGRASVQRTLQLAQARKELEDEDKRLMLAGISRNVETNQGLPFAIGRATRRGYLSRQDQGMYSQLAATGDPLTQQAVRQNLELREQSYKQELQLTMQYANRRLDVIRNHYESAIQLEQVKLEGADRKDRFRLGYASDIAGIERQRVGIDRTVRGTLEEERQYQYGQSRRPIQNLMQLMSMFGGGSPELSMVTRLQDFSEQQRRQKEQDEERRRRDQESISTYRRTMGAAAGVGFSEGQMAQSEQGRKFLLEQLQAILPAMTRSGMGEGIQQRMGDLLDMNRGMALARMSAGERERRLRLTSVNKELSTFDQTMGSKYGSSEEALVGRAELLKKKRDLLADSGDVAGYQAAAKEYEAVLTKLPEKTKAALEDAQKASLIELKTSNKWLQAIYNVLREGDGQAGGGIGNEHDGRRVKVGDKKVKPREYGSLKPFSAVVATDEDRKAFSEAYKKITPSPYIEGGSFVKVHKQNKKVFIRGYSDEDRKDIIERSVARGASKKQAEDMTPGGGWKELNEERRSDQVIEIENSKIYDKWEAESKAGLFPGDRRWSKEESKARANDEINRRKLAREKNKEYLKKKYGYDSDKTWQDAKNIVDDSAARSQQIQDAVTFERGWWKSDEEKERDKKVEESKESLENFKKRTGYSAAVWAYEQAGKSDLGSSVSAPPEGAVIPKEFSNDLNGHIDKFGSFVDKMQNMQITVSVGQSATISPNGAGAYG